MAVAWCTISEIPNAAVHASYESCVTCNTCAMPQPAYPAGKLDMTGLTCACSCCSAELAANDQPATNYNSARHSQSARKGNGRAANKEETAKLHAATNGRHQVSIEHCVACVHVSACCMCSLTIAGLKANRTWVLLRCSLLYGVVFRFPVL